MSESDTTDEQRDDQLSREDIWRVQNLVAGANQQTAHAVKTATAMTDQTHPEMGLANTHGDLVEAYAEARRALNRLEQTIDQHAADYAGPTPRRIVDEHGDRLEEQYDGPVFFLATQILQRNRREWLHAKPDTQGAEAVERHGLTANQREWLNQLQAAWEAYDDG